MLSTRKRFIQWIVLDSVIHLLIPESLRRSLYLIRCLYLFPLFTLGGDYSANAIAAEQMPETNILNQT